MTTYHQEVLLAMELDRSHIGKLVQMITDSWSMTGTLTRVDQHDNREWEIAYPSRQLVPVRGEIYTTLHIGPWVGDVIGNQPVTVETVKGTLEAPETAVKAVTALITDEEVAEAKLAVRKGYYPEGMGEDPPAIEGTVVRPEAVDVAKLQDEVRRGERTVNSARAAMGFPAFEWPADADDLPPEPPAEWHKR